MKYAIGDKVKIKDFSQLVKEYGTTPTGDVLIKDFYYKKDMKVYCGETHTVTDYYGGDLDVYELDTDRPCFFVAEALEATDK